MTEFSQTQIDIAKNALTQRVFLSGQAGTGKTQTGKAFIHQLKSAQVSGNSLLILVPQRSLGLTYQNYLQETGDFNGGLVSIQTLGGVAQRMIRLFWPIFSNRTNFANPGNPPVFLNLETAQYYLDKISQPYFERGYFESIRAEKARILSQILDNLNKSALVGFSYQEIGNKLKSAWNESPGHLHAFDEAQEMATKFRQFCLANNFLDFSLQIEIFQEFLWSSLLCQEYLFRSYPYIIYDNCEEDSPVMHDILLDWLPNSRGALIIFDENAGFRSFLGADPISAKRLNGICESSYELSESLTDNNHVLVFQKTMRAALNGQSIPSQSTILDVFHSKFDEFYPQMTSSIVENINELIRDGILPGEIVILAPFVSDALRFQIQQQLRKFNLTLASHRPSRSLQEEPLTHVLLTWAKIAHPHWQLKPSLFDVRLALIHSLAGMDAFRADILSKVAYHPANNFWLNDISSILLETQERVSNYVSINYQKIITWLQAYQNDPADLDVFIARLFGEVLTQPGFGLKDNFSDADVTNRLIQSIQEFRRVLTEGKTELVEDISKEYVTTIEKGLIAALHLESWEAPPLDRVYLAPAHTFLVQNRMVKYQFWVDIGSMGWWQRIMQPLTQPFVLSRNWKDGEKWTDLHEFETNTSNLRKLVAGLLSRCSTGIYVFASGFNESGNEERGPLLKAFQRILRANSHV